MEKKWGLAVGVFGVKKPDGLDEKMQAHWDVYVKPVTGHATYADMLADLAA